MDIVTYALCKKLISGVASGVSGYEVDGLTLKITTTDGQILEMTFPEPKDGVSVKDIKIDENNHLICVMSDGSEIDAGLIENGGGSDYPDVTKEDIDKLFENEPEEPLVTKEDIDALFDE